VIRFEAVSVAPGLLAGGAPGEILLRDLDLAFTPGESHLILGANGSGKTTLLRVLAGLLAPASGHVLLDGKPLAAPSHDVHAEGRCLWPDLAILFEEPDPQFLTDRVEAEVSFGLESLSLEAADVRARALDAMASLGLRGLEAREPQSLSAGEKARTLLAAMLVARPRVLALDQSLAHLDARSRREIESGVVGAALAGERVVIRTHQDADPPFPGERLWVLHQGGFTDVANWSPEAVLSADRIPFPLAMRVCALLATHGLWSGPLMMDSPSLAAAFSERGQTGEAAMEGSVSKASRGRVVLAFNDVSWVPARAPRSVVRDIGFDLREGEIVALLGASGSGKTTILKLAARLRTPTNGTIRREGDRVRGTALALEFPERQLFGRTVAEDVAAALWVRGGMAARERLSRTEAALSAVGLDPARFADRVPSSLSEGEKRRAALAGFLVEPAPVLLLDEPTAGLDPEGRRAMKATLRRLAAAGTAVLFASHDLDFVLGVADRAIVIGRDAEGAGKILADAPPGVLWQEDTTQDGYRGASLAGVPGSAPDAITIGTMLRRFGYVDSNHAVRDSDSAMEALASSLAARSHGSGGRPGAKTSEATSARR